MNTLEAAAIGQAAREAGNDIKVLDWDKLREFVKGHEGEISVIRAGLVEDWGWTGDIVYTDKDGWLNPTMAYTESIWATPIAYISWKAGYDGIHKFSDFIVKPNE